MTIHSLYQLFLDQTIVTTDTRKIVPGSIFFALKGEHFDGNTFAQQALAEGAAYAVVSDPALQGEKFFFVPDTLQALQDLASYHRQHLTIPVIGITGTNGKTTTKELVARVLGERFRVHATQGNLNNHIGVPLTILSTPGETEIIVCEMGANHIGEIAALCRIARPTHGLITNIGRAHLEGFGSFEGVRTAKSELYQYVDQSEGRVFINMDDPSLSGFSQSISNKVTYGLKKDIQADYHFEYRPLQNEPGFIIHDRAGNFEISSSMFGNYNASNVLAAYAVGCDFEVAPDVIRHAIASYIPTNNRSQMLEWKKCTIVKDAYNANPSSMELAIKAFDAQFPNGILILGDMKELGESSVTAHQQIADLAMSTTAKKIYLVGPEFTKAIVPQDDRIELFLHVDELRQDWNWSACAGNAILLKGSRSMRLEELLAG